MRTYASRRTAVARRAAPRVLVDNEASVRATLVEVRAPDGIAVLYRITHALADLGLDVRHAKVATLGAEVVDAFYVTDTGGKKVDVSRRQEMQRAILTALSGPAPRRRMMPCGSWASWSSPAVTPPQPEARVATPVPEPLPRQQPGRPLPASEPRRGQAPVARVH